MTLCQVIPTKWRSCRDHSLCDVISPCAFTFASHMPKTDKRKANIDSLDHTQVCVQLPTYAVNVALPAFAVAAPCCCGAGRAAYVRYLLPAGPTAANPPHAAAAGEWERQAVGGTDRQTDRRTTYRYIYPPPHTMRAVPVRNVNMRFVESVLAYNSTPAYIRCYVKGLIYWNKCTLWHWICRKLGYYPPKSLY